MTLSVKVFKTLWMSREFWYILVYISFVRKWNSMKVSYECQVNCCEEVVFSAWEVYNVTPKDDTPPAVVPVTEIQKYKIWLKCIYVVLLLRSGVMHGMDDVGDTLRIKMPQNQCTSDFGFGWVIGIISLQYIEADSIWGHLWDIQPLPNISEDINNVL